MNRHFFFRPVSLIAVGVLLFVGFFSFAAPTHAAKKSFTITAEQWSFSPSTITVAEGDTVALSIKSIDVDHGFSLPEFGVESTISAGKTTSVEFVASKAGSFTFSCSVYCGSDHNGMSGTLVVESASNADPDPEPEEDSSEDSTSPSISSVSVAETGETTATLTWKTDEASVGQVEYGTSSGSYIAGTPLEDKTTTNHTAYLTGLTPGQKYYYRVKSQDADENLARSSEASLTAEEKEEDKTCDDVECDDGEKCEMKEEECDEATCDEVPTCVDDDKEDNENDNENNNTNDSDEEDSVVTVAYLQGENDSQKWEPTDNIEFVFNEPITITGSAPAGTEVIAEFCCALTQYTTIADDSGEWTIQGNPALPVGKNYVKIYAKDSENSADRIDIEILEHEREVIGTDDVNEKGFFASHWVAIVILLGLGIVVVSGVTFVRQLRRR